MKTLGIALRTLLYVTVFLLLFAYLGLRLRAFDRNFAVSFPIWIGPVGIVLMVLGGICGFLCIATFVMRGEGTPALFDSPRKFVAVGPYRYCRNPMYVGGLALLAGFGLRLRSVSILIMTVVAFGIVNLLVIFYEEPTLNRKFGESYVTYCREVRRWLPNLSRR